MKAKLDSVSSSFCLVRWKHATINLSTGTSKSCCHHPFKKIDLNLKNAQFHDNKEEREMRSKMLNGKQTKDCSYCWWIESNQYSSDRQNWSAKSWMAPFFDEVVEDISDKASNPSWVELNFSSVCNLKCVYCSPIFSSKWYKEIKEFGAYPTKTPHNSITGLGHLEFEETHENQEILEQFWPWFYKILPDLRLLKLTGGEPLLSPQAEKMLDMMLETPSPQLSLGINSNLSIGPKKWRRFVDQIKALESKQVLKDIYLHPSLDCFGERAEYIRHGLDMSSFRQNVELFLDETEASVHFICTLSNLAMGSLLDYWKYVLELKQTHFKPNREIAIGTEVLKYPEWLSINLLPEEMSRYFDEVISFIEKNLDESGRGFNRVELEGVQKAKSAFQNKPDSLQSQKKNFTTFVNEIDRRRNTKFSETFPELLNFYESC